MTPLPLDDIQAREPKCEPWRDKSKQMRCPTCGRFAYWSEDAQEWRLSCVGWDSWNGAWEHD